MQTKDIQKDFLSLMQEKYVVSETYIKHLFNIRNVEKFVEGVRDRTGLDIYQGRRFSFEADQDEKVFFMISDIVPEAPGLDGMQAPIEVPLLDSHERIVYYKGYYLMWDCPNMIGDTLCGQFHKVDLGDEQIKGRIDVRCIKCGKQYIIEG